MYVAASLAKAPYKAFAAYNGTNGPRFGNVTANVGYVTRTAAGATVSQGIIEGESFAQGDDVNLVTEGIYEIEAGAAYADGAELASDSVGRAVTAVSTDYIMGFAKGAATQAGDVTTIVLKGQRIKP